MFSSPKCEHALVKRQNFQLIRATYAFWMKNNVSIGEGEYADEILDVSISFLNDHLEETLGPTKIGENHSKSINLTQVSVLS